MAFCYMWIDLPLVSEAGGWWECGLEPDISDSVQNNKQKEQREGFLKND